jgi:L-asparaginase/Glu-tRNA(Gln) amidotransferase subunit D
LLIGLGTDTTDIFLPLLDTLFFDKDVHPILVTGANRSFREKDSDAPQNFEDLAYATHLRLKNGAYYVFQHTIFRGGDVVKIDPREDPQSIEGMLTFFAPHRSHMKLGTVDYDTTSSYELRYQGQDLRVWSALEIFHALQKIWTINIGQMNDIEQEVTRILDPAYPALIIESHALGNVSAPIRRAVKEAMKQNKLVINVSRCIVPDTSDRYSATLSREEGVINGSKISQAVARGILLRALLEKRTKELTQELVLKYLESLGLN